MTDEERKELLKTIKTIAVVGISKNETSPVTWWQDTLKV